MCAQVPFNREGCASVDGQERSPATGRLRDDRTYIGARVATLPRSELGYRAPPLAFET